MVQEYENGKVVLNQAMFVLCVCCFCVWLTRKICCFCVCVFGFVIFGF